LEGRDIPDLQQRERKQKRERRKEAQDKKKQREIYSNSGGERENDRKTVKATILMTEHNAARQKSRMFMTLYDVFFFFQINLDIHCIKNQ